MDLALSVKDLNYYYIDDWSRRKFHALKDISLDVFSGEAFGFLGHNGAGKTSTIKCILDLIRPKSGTIEILGKPHRDVLSRTQIGYLPEQPYFYDYLTVQETLELFGCLAGVPHAELASNVSRALALVKLNGREKSRIRTLSKGLTQRVALAQAIVHSPKVLILDEPFSGLDPIGRREFRELLLQLKSEGSTIFMSSHVLSDVEFMCNRVSIMVKGVLKGIFEIDALPDVGGSSYVLTVRNPQKLQGEFEGQGISQKREGRFARIEFSDRQSAEKALQIAIIKDAGVENFEHRGGTLEDVFVSLVNSDKAQ